MRASVSPPTRPSSTQGPTRKDRRQQHSAGPLQGRCALHIWVRSAPQKVRLEKIASGEFGDLHQTDQGV